MNVKEAVAKRIEELCAQKDITINTLGNVCGMNPSTIYSIMNSKSKNPGITTIKKICDGLEVKLSVFFDSKLFDDLTQEIE